MSRFRRIIASASTLLLVSAVLVVGSEKFDHPAHASGSGGGVFQVGNYATGTSTGGNFKRGYVFEVSEATAVTGLSGAGTSGGTFVVGLYQLESFNDFSSSGGKVCEADSVGKVSLDGRTGNDAIIDAAPGASSSTVMVRKLLGSMEFSGAEADGKVVAKPITPVTLYPECSYLLAQMRTSGSGSHATVRGLDLVPLLNHPRIARWGPPATDQTDAPSGGVLGGVYRWRSASSATTFVDQRPGDIDPDYPNLGLRFESDYSLPEVRTNTASIDGSTVTFSLTVISSGEFGGTHPELQLAFEWGTSEDVETSGTFSVAGSTPFGADDPAGETKTFTPNTPLNEGETYFYRAVAINEAGRAEGQLRSFTFTPAPVVEELSLTSAGPNTSTASANLVFGGTSDVTEHGFCYATTSNPDLDDDCVRLGAASGTGPFSSSISWDQAGESVKVRAFATNATGTTFSSPAEITAPINSSLPQIVGTDFATGAELSGTDGTWQDGGLSITQTTYQWRATLGGITNDIPGATSIELSCIPQSADVVGATLSLSVTKSNAVGSTTAVSVPSTAVQDADPCASPPPPPAPPTRERAQRPAPAPVVVAEAPTPPPGRTTPVAPAPAPTTATGPVLRGNVVPTAPQQPVARVGNRDIPVTSQVNTPNRLDVRAGSVSLGVNVPQNVGGVRQQTGGATELDVRSGGQTTLQGGGVLARSTVQVFMPLQGSNAKQIAQIQADDSGNFNGDAVFATQRTEPPLPIGRQVLQIVSLDDAGEQVVMEMAVVISQPAPAPEFDRTSDSLPTLQPGAFYGMSAGEPVDLSVRTDRNQGVTVVEGTDFQMSVSFGGQELVTEEADEDAAASLTFVRDQVATVTGGGFMPGTRADIWLFSDPTLMASVTIGGTGEFSGDLVVDGRQITVGEHTLQLQGVGTDGYVRSANLGVLVSDGDEPVATADVASSFAWWFWIIGIVALLAVLLVALWLYRRANQAI